ncbi:MAG: tRNA (adenosine(37)-N6)-threonylcarbamoyltransferase complex dimerization subunit type 1 TsaB [Gemmatimonas sp.]|nr:tRNA (adenosine(37)-N6)-threonylcarbamoyltransferase complex dimerization subunit type 1 TsaB [Gemmatimonas sp.]
MHTIPLPGPVLAIEASTSAGSVALWVDGIMTGVEAVPMGVGREDRLFPAMQRLLGAAGVRPGALEAVVCGEGPGSFTSLRIASSLAKGLAHGTGCPLYAVSSLLIAAASTAEALAEGRYLVHADALRGERYVLPVVRRADGLVASAGPFARLTLEQLATEAVPSQRLAVLSSPLAEEVMVVSPTIASLSAIVPTWADEVVSLELWEPVYGRLAEAQVKWEATHGISLPASPAVAS